MSDEDVLRDSSVVSPVGRDDLLEASESATGPEAAADLPVGPVALWFGALGSPIAWAVHLMLMYPLVELACRWQTSLPLYITAGSLGGVAALAGLVSWRSVRAMERHNGATVPRRARFMGRFGRWSGVLFVMLIVVGGTLPVVFDDPCQLPGRRPPTVLPHL